MIHTRCQVCGRRKHERKAGGIAHHHVQGVPCLGIGHPPLDVDDARLEQCARDVAAEARRLYRELTALRDRRANYIPPELVAAESRASVLADKLARRLKRHRDWPAHYEREMMTLGYAMPPPAYLLARLRPPQ